MTSTCRLFRFLIVFAWISLLTPALAQLPPSFKPEQIPPVRTTQLVRKYLTPLRIVWTSDDNSGTHVKNRESILKPGNGQPDLNPGTYLTLISDDKSKPGIVLDFGREIQGGLFIVTSAHNSNPAGRIRVRFGESVAEACAELSVKGQTPSGWTYGAYNDHSMRDFEVVLPVCGCKETGQTGFRFVRIDLVEPNKELEIKEISAAFVYRDIPYLGSFKCNDERLNDIWMTGAHTVHLNMQDYLMEGVKRDRLVWTGDMYPEVKVINSVFGFNEVVPKSLDLERDNTPLPGWMNRAYPGGSILWIWTHLDWYMHHGDLEYLKEQRDYLAGLLRHLASKVDADGREILDGSRHTDWNNVGDLAAQHEALQAWMVMAFEAGRELSIFLDDKETELLCARTIRSLKKHVPEMGGTKQGAAMLALAGLVPAEKANSEILAKDGVHGLSTLSAPFILEARVLGGDFRGALDNARRYYGGMLDLGATSFWENFHIEWMENAARIDEVVPEGKVDVHGDRGEGCYVSYRHSLCHGWGGAISAWLTEYVLGVRVAEPGCRTVRIEPNLGDLEWVEGTFPTPLGVLKIKHKREDDGKIVTSYEAPEGIRVRVNKGP